MGAPKTEQREPTLKGGTGGNVEGGPTRYGQDCTDGLYGPWIFCLVSGCFNWHWARENSSRLDSLQTNMCKHILYPFQQDCKLVYTTPKYNFTLSLDTGVSLIRILVPRCSSCASLNTLVTNNLTAI